MRKIVPLVLVVALAAGCGRGGQGLLSHGETVDHWLEALKDRDPAKRKKAVTALGHVGTADPAAIPAVAGALQDSDPRVRAEAALALLNIGPPARDAIPALEAAKKDRDATVRSYAQKALTRIQGNDNAD
jgi:HEAT repeat protein